LCPSLSDRSSFGGPSSHIFRCERRYTGYRTYGKRKCPMSTSNTVLMSGIRMVRTGVTVYVVSIGMMASNIIRGHEWKMTAPAGTLSENACGASTSSDSLQQTWRQPQTDVDKVRVCDGRKPSDILAEGPGCLRLPLSTGGT
jgi:hypothetical protein